MSSNYQSASTSQNRPYQGYPYANPTFTDAPSLKPGTSPRWQNLPVRYISTKQQFTPDDQQLQESKDEEIPDRIPSPITRQEEDEPSVKIYIDIPEEPTQGSSKSSAIPDRSLNYGTDSVENTIFYDPYRDRTDMDNIEETPSIDSDNTDNESSEEPGESNQPYQVPVQNYKKSIPVSPFMMNETNIYGQTTPDDGFSLHPLPISDYPPPPAYTEVDVTKVVVEQPRGETVPPRTQVILPQGVVPNNNDRRNIKCHKCGTTVNSLVVRQAGLVTHIVAFVFLITCLFPITIAIYCTNCCKYKNHYCPECNRVIGYEIPMLCQDIVYTTN